jgi:hypothetical protein
MRKSDIEGMVISVLHGLADVIQRKRPMLFIEVDIENDDAFLGWVNKNEYAILKKLTKDTNKIRTILWWVREM